MFENNLGQTLLGAVGLLQFEIVAHRLKTEYQVDAVYDSSDTQLARWLVFPDEPSRKKFEREQTMRLAQDVDGNPVYLASNRYNLQVTIEHWPDVKFLSTREHGERLS